ncbi:hypothetical protein [Streptomyces sp. NPDC018693]|uniref:hypothetical protein n=1 Tax=unclassified Streptomyces TaxID=2593676 RepID=UPI00379CCD0F
MLLLLAGIGVLALALPGAVREGRDYEAAPRCPAHQPAPECRWQGLVTVTGKEYRSGKPGSYHLQLSRDARTSQWVKMGQQGFGIDRDVYDAVEAGDTVTAVYWRGLVREVAYQELRQGTDDHPGTAYRLPLGGGLALLSLGAGITSVAWRAWRTAGRPRARHDWRALIPMMSCTLYAMANFAIAVRGTTSMAVSLVVSGGVGAVILTVALVRARVQLRRERRPSPTVPVHPQVPYGEIVVPGKVLGNVPYALPGHTHLVAAPGLLASVPGAGKVRRGTYPDPLPGPRAYLPSTLTPIRVREPRAEDPAGGPAECHVIECRDGAWEVLLAVDIRATGQVLGAFASRNPAPTS